MTTTIAHTNADNILVVDDEPYIVELLKEFLCNRFTLTFTANGEMAISHLAENNSRIDLILLDHNLPDTSGIEVLKKVKEIKPSLPVIMITAFGNEDIAASAFRYGAREYIKKPFMYKELIEKIDFCLALQKKPYFAARRVLFSDNNSHSNYINTAKQTVNIQRAISYINDNFSSKLSLDIVARKAYMSKYHFSRAFKVAVEVTYQEYLNNIRIHKAAGLLSNRTQTITDIAFSVGYCDLTHFARIFKRIIGYSPSTYRKIILQLDSDRIARVGGSPSP
jgi:two-component system, response regulator YesN